MNLYSGFSVTILQLFVTDLYSFYLYFNRYAKPFDRHDWIVERSNGEEVRYVIDFYGGARAGPSANGKSRPVSLYLDVRPAADSVSAIVARLSFALRQRFQPLSLPRWCLMGSPFFQAVHASSSDKDKDKNKTGGNK